METKQSTPPETTATWEYRPPVSREPIANRAAAIVICLLAIVYVHTNVVGVLERWSTPGDFSVCYQAAKDISGGLSPYSHAPYFYPPFVAFLMAPFAWTDFRTAGWIWLLLSQLLLLAAAWLTWRASGRRVLGLVCIAAVWALGGAAAETLKIGQLSPVLLVAIAATYNGRRAVQDTAVSAAFAIKYFPGVLAVALLLERGWRRVLRLSGMAILAVAVPWLLLACFFTGPRAPIEPHYWLGTPAMFSWSLPSLALRILTPIHRGARLPDSWEYGNVAGKLHLAPSLEMLSVSIALATLLGGILALSIACRGKLRAAQAPFAMAALVSLSLVAAPVSWTHYQLLQYPGVALLLNYALCRRNWGFAAGVALCFALCYQLPELILIHYHNAHSGWYAYSPFTLWLWTSIAPFATFGLFVLALSVVRRERQTATGKCASISQAPVRNGTFIPRADIADAAPARPQ